jgi:hypothetical protein
VLLSPAENSTAASMGNGFRAAGMAILGGEASNQLQ